jgi:septal ring factor EnvC (AmiA/AmiB activator)
MGELGKLLAYGAIGLGLALAVLSFFLLRKEQDMVTPRRELIRAIYVFMFFALVLSAGAFVAESFKTDQTSVAQLQTDLALKSTELEQLELEKRKIEQRLSQARSQMQSVMNIKEGKIARMNTLDPEKPEFPALVREIQQDLEEIDAELAKVLDALAPGS